MTDRSLLLPALLLAVAGVAGCPVDQTGCRSDADCAAGTLCRSMMCVEEQPDPAADSGPAPTDSGPQPDAGPQDSGPQDSGPQDSGPQDSGTADAGDMDAGDMDAGDMDAGADAGDAG